jgi:hypothetical protein
MGLGGLIRETLVNRNFWYVFGVLLPFGVWRLRQIPRAWVVASACGTFVALTLGVYKGSAGNVARPIFNLIGPLLSLSTALLIGVSTGRRRR